MIYLVSDTHFYHKNIIEYCHRPFKHIGEMNQTLISNWNSVVCPDDEVFHLGDFTMAHFVEGKWESYKQAYIRTCRELLAQLNGHKTLILGNHDAKARVSRECGWEAVEKQMVLDGYLLTHRPCEPTFMVMSMINCHSIGESRKGYTSILALIRRGSALCPLLISKK